MRCWKQGVRGPHVHWPWVSPGAGLHLRCPGQLTDPAGVGEGDIQAFQGGASTATLPECPNQPHCCSCRLVVWSPWPEGICKSLGALHCSLGSRQLLPLANQLACPRVGTGWEHVQGLSRAGAGEPASVEALGAGGVVPVGSPLKTPRHHGSCLSPSVQTQPEEHPAQGLPRYSANLKLGQGCLVPFWGWQGAGSWVYPRGEGRVT